MVKLTLRERESIQEAVRRFRKLVERSGIKKGNVPPRILRKAQRNQTACATPCRAAVAARSNGWPRPDVSVLAAAFLSSAWQPGALACCAPAMALLDRRPCPARY